MRVATLLVVTGHLFAAALSILIGELVVFVSSVSVPNLHVPIRLFQLYSETIGIDVYGAFLPVFLSVGLFVALRRSNVPGGMKPCRGYLFWLSVAIVGLVFVVLFAYLRLGVGTFSLTSSEAETIVPLSGALGILYSLRRRFPASIVGLETYIIGTFGVFLSDLFLSLTGISQAPGLALVWGGNGSHDLVLWFGLYLAVPAFCFGLISPGFVSFLRRFVPQ
jgi:hypothetical protein